MGTECTVYKSSLSVLLHHLAVHVVLVTDLVAVLSERDQKYNLPAILDLKVSPAS